jgi:hypothetical protein
MPELNDKIEVGFRGAVSKGGLLLLTKPATIRSGLAAAGGLAPATAKMWPAGIIRVRRKREGRMFQNYQFDMADTPAEWEHFELQAGDAVIFQWHVEMNNAA